MKWPTSKQLFVSTTSEIPAFILFDLSKNGTESVGSRRLYTYWATAAPHSVT